eukprot:1090128-Pleurochrysis_carterae.AAC.1
MSGYMASTSLPRRFPYCSQLSKPKELLGWLADPRLVQLCRLWQQQQQQQQQQHPGGGGAADVARYDAMTSGITVSLMRTMIYALDPLTTLP